MDILGHHLLILQLQLAVRLRELLVIVLKSPDLLLESMDLLQVLLQLLIEGFLLSGLGDVCAGLLQLILFQGSFVFVLVLQQGLLVLLLHLIDLVLLSRESLLQRGRLGGFGRKRMPDLVDLGTELLTPLDLLLDRLSELLYLILV